MFGPDDLLTGFYESMFQPEFFDRLNRFFGCAPDSDFIARRFNTTEPGAGISEGLRVRAVGMLRPIYASCAERFPETRYLWARSLSGS